jgi:hypothetical protein
MMVCCEHGNKPLGYEKEAKSFMISRTTSASQKRANSVALVREQTIPTELPPLVGEVSANFCGYRSRGQRNRSLRSYFRFSRPASRRAA